MVLVFLGFAGASIYYSCLTIQQLSHTWGPFPDCYLCPPKKIVSIPRPPLVSNTTMNGTLG